MHGWIRGVRALCEQGGLGLYAGRELLPLLLFQEGSVGSVHVVGTVLVVMSARCSGGVLVMVVRLLLQVVILFLLLLLLLLGMMMLDYCVCGLLMGVS